MRELASSEGCFYGMKNTWLCRCGSLARVKQTFLNVVANLEETYHGGAGVQKCIW